MNSPRRPVITLCLALALLLAGGCSALSLAYLNASRLGTLWINRALDLPAAHREVVANAVEALHQWHRAGPRLELAGLLREAQRRLAGPITRGDGEWLIEQLQGHVSGLGVQLAERAGPGLPPLTASELERVERRLASRREDSAEEWLEGGPERERARRIERIEDSAREWFGSLAASQEQLIEASPAVSGFDIRLWLDERARRERELLAALASEDRTARLRSWFSDWRSGRPVAVAQALEGQRADSIALWVTLANDASPEQRRHLRARLSDWAEVFENAGD